MPQNQDELTPIQFVKAYDENVKSILNELKVLIELVKSTQKFDELKAILPRIFKTNSKISQLRKACNQNSKKIAIHTDKRNQVLLTSNNQFEKATRSYFDAKAHLSRKERDLKQTSSVLITACLMLPFIMSSTLDLWIKFGYPLLIVAIIINFYLERKTKKKRLQSLNSVRQLLREISISNREYSSFVYANADISQEMIELLFDNINELEEMSMAIEEAVTRALELGDAHG